MIPINDDEINEPNEYFMISLVLVGAIHPERVNLDNRNVSVCKIVDNDRKYTTAWRELIRSVCRSLMSKAWGITFWTPHTILA